MINELNINGLQIAYEQRGAGPPLVLLHGGLSDGRIWKRQMDALSGTFTVVAWDAPGCGRSSDPPENFSLSDYADCLAAVIDELNLIHPHILGLSFGGGLALEFYRKYPRIPRSLILASAYAGWAGSLPPETVKDRLQKGIHQSTLPPKQVVETWLPSLFSKSTPAEVIDETAEVMKDFHPAGMRVMLRAFAQADLRDVLPAIEIPVLLLYGDKDQRSPLHIAREFHEMIPASELVVIKEAGHVLNIEAAEKFNAEVLRFLTSF